jgi:hypothetical protein
MSTFDRRIYFNPKHSTTDEDLSAMYLTDKKNGKPRMLSDHDELEILLESFSKQVEEIVNESETIAVRLLHMKDDYTNNSHILW